MTDKTSSIPVRLDRETAAYLADLAKASGVDRPTFVRLLAVNYGKDQAQRLELPSGGRE